MKRAATVIAVLMAPAALRAEPTRNINMNIFDPTPSTTGSAFAIQTADVGLTGDIGATAVASYASSPLVLATMTNDDRVIDQQTMLTVGGAYAFKERYEAGARLPLYSQDGETIPTGMGMFGAPPAKGAALGDLTLHGKAQLYQQDKLTIGGSLALTLPTATDSEFTGSDWPTARLLGLGSYVASRRFTLHANLGLALRKRITFANIEQGTGPTFGAGVVYRAYDKLFFNLEAFGDLIPSGHYAPPAEGETIGESSMLATIEGLFATRVQITRQYGVSLAFSRGLTSAIGTPALRGALMFTYTPSGRELPTLHRAWVAKPVDLSKYDSDGDQVPDSVDKCVNVKEDWDKFEDDDGCPDLDDDNDSVKDATDKCRLIAEDIDGFEDSDGCPDPDNDKDGILDGKDKCPDEAEKINGNADDDGCPDGGDSLVISNPERLELMENVAFNGPAIAKNDTSILAQLAATLRARTDIVRLRITVHVQPTKTPAKDQALTEKRALAIKEWLVAWGIKPDRIEVRGFGGNKPLIPPTQKGAASVNDRVELIILERNLIKK